MGAHGFLRRRFDRLGVADALGLPFGDGPAGGKIAVHRIMRRSLVGQCIGPQAALHHFRKYLCCIAEHADRYRLAGLVRALDDGERLIDA